MSGRLFPRGRRAAAAGVALTAWLSPCEADCCDEAAEEERLASFGGGGGGSSSEKCGRLGEGGRVFCRDASTSADEVNAKGSRGGTARFGRAAPFLLLAGGATLGGGGGGSASSRSTEAARDGLAAAREGLFGGGRSYNGCSDKTLAEAGAHHKYLLYRVLRLLRCLCARWPSGRHSEHRRGRARRTLLT